MKKYLLLFLAMGFVLVNCNKSDDNVIDDVVSEEPTDDTEVVKLRADYPVQDFMWQAMNLYYFYQDDVPNLDEDLFTLEEYIELLSSEANPEDFFFNKLVFADDRFSFLNDDYKELTQAFSGISKSNGLEFGLARYNNTEVIYGYVRYVIKNSDASTKDISRGELFTAIDGAPLYYNSADDNNTDALFSGNDTYTLGMADFVNDEFILNGKEVSLTKQEGLVEDPVLVNKVLDIGEKNIGYLMYNQFAGNSGETLNNAFGEFKSAGVTDLVLDLRYNPGGFGYITQILGSLIHQSDASKVFYNRRYNTTLEEAWDLVGGQKTYFVADTGTNDDHTQTPLNSLDLKKIYVIATGSSASASELLINGLRPYLEVVHIGSTTVGKNQGSFTLVDSPETGYGYDADNEDLINPDNQWAIQPITSQTENSEGFGDYSEGLVPTIAIDEDFAELGILGDPSERMLARALQEIDGASAKKDLSSKYPVDLISSSSLVKAGGGKLIFRDMPHTLSGKFNSSIK